MGRPTKRKISGNMESMEITDASAENSQSKPPEKKVRANDYGTETRKIQVPKHRMVPLKENWLKIFNPVVEHLKLQIRFNLKTKKVEIRTSKDTQDISNLQKAADFVQAFILGFEV